MKTTPKSFMLQLGSLIALYVSVTSLLILIFSVTNIRFPDEVTWYWSSEGARESVRNSIAVLFVFFPTYIIFTRLSNQDRRKHAQGEYALLAKWFVYATILIGILILLGDLVTLINYFLNGEITSRFLIKVAALILIIGATLGYYILDMRGHFKKQVRHSLYFAAGTSVFVIASIVCGYSYIETPSEVREMRIDQQQVTDLQNMQWGIEELYRLNDELPENMEAVYPEHPAPIAPEGRESYTYNKTDETHYELCATFAHPSAEMMDNDYRVDTMPYHLNNNWQHEAETKCFKRVITKMDEKFPY